MNRVCHLDFETYSSVNIKDCGLENYIAAPDFAVLCMAWAFDDKPRVYSLPLPFLQGRGLPAAVLAHIHAGGEIRAWNASFEFAILKDHYKVDVAPEQMTCVMQKALQYGLPAGLLKAGQALKLSTLKDESKRLLMLAMGRPRAKGGTWHEDPLEGPARLIELERYCIDDVRAERAVDRAVPDLHPWERRLAVLDMKINRKGVLVDKVAIRALMYEAGRALAEVDAECAALTGGEVTSPGTQTAKLLAWLHAQGWTSINDVTKETVSALLGRTSGSVCTGMLRRVLELRQMAAKSSIAKLDRMLDVASFRDDRARNLLQFSGAGRTLRWAGRLVQPQNLPRVPKGFDADRAIEVAMAEPGALGLLYGSPLETVSQCLRACFVAAPGHMLVSVDLSQIEARVLAWLAGQQDVVEAFARGEDVYTLAAAKVGSHNRQLGKVLTLACGYGMGWMKFQETAAKAPYNIDLDAGEAKTHLRAWRDANTSITSYWGTMETAVVISIQQPGAVVDMTHGMAVRTQDGVTQIRKPNGVKLTYHNMRLWNGDLVFDGVNSKTKAWGVEKAYGGRLVENVVQSVARDVMAEGMLANDEIPTTTIHDEIVWEVEDGFVPTIKAPSWAPGLPIAWETHSGKRYSK